MDPTSNPPMKRPRTDDSNHSLVKIQPSIFQTTPLDDLTHQIVRFLCKNIRPDLKNVEIEAKLGVFIDKKSNDRVYLPIRSETVLENESWYRFESNMSMQQHAHFNKILNQLVEKGTLKYSHIRQTDLFYSKGNSRIRVSVDQKTNQIIGVIQKQRIADLNILRPAHPLDFRISINTENVVPRPSKDEKPANSRNKDRLSYTHDSCIIDLTQVKSEDRKDPMHELEIEFKDSERICDESVRYASNTPNQFVQYVQALVNNVRILSEKSLPS